jgi:O-antigen/teichoic acid export membrane protein
VSVLSPTNVVRRERAIRLTVAASVGAKAFSMLCTFAQVPLALHYLGTEAYGFWITLFSIMLVLNSVDFGLGVGMQHAMARAFGNDDMESMKRTFWTGAASLFVLGLAVLLVGIPIARLAPWEDILRIRDPALRAESGTALSIAIMAFVVGLPLNAATRLAAALQRGWMNAGWIAFGSACALGLVASAAAWRWGFLWFLAASLLVPTVQGIGMAVHLLLSLGWPIRPTRLAPASEIRSMLRSSLYFAFPQFGMALLQSAPAVAISIAAGSSAVTGYNLLLRLFSPFQQGQVILLTPVWPAYTEAHERQDHTWNERTLLRTLGAFGALSAGVALVAWQSHAILSIWVGGSADKVPAGLASLVAVWVVLQMAAQPFLYYLIGVGRLRQLAWAATPGFLIASAALFFGRITGSVAGVLGAGAAALVLALLPPLAWETFRTARRLVREGAPP